MEQIEAMTPFQARLNLLLFFLIAGLISANALYFQDSAHSSKPKFASPAKPERKSSPVAIRQNVTAPKKEKVKTIETTQAIQREDKPQILQTSSSEATSDLVKAVQRELKARGYSPGVIDGAPGLETRAAILAFEYDKGLPLTATPSEQLLEKIIFGTSGNEQASSHRAGKTRTSRHVVRLVQRVLHSLGYAAGKINGIAGKDTQTAIREFEADRRLKVTGRVSGRLIQELMKVADLPTGR